MRPESHSLAMGLEVQQIESSERRTPTWCCTLDVQEFYWGNACEKKKKERKPRDGGETCQITVQCEGNRIGGSIAQEGSQAAAE